MALDNASRTRTAGETVILPSYEPDAPKQDARDWRETTLADIQHLRFQSFSEPTGTLVPISGELDVPFQIARVFTITASTEGAVRGSHALQYCRQVLVCLNGKCTVTCDDGSTRRHVVLDSPEQGLYLPPAIWRKLTYSAGATLMVVCDQLYSTDEYISDYGVFERSKTAS